MNIYESVKEFYESYPGDKRIIGQSYLGRNLYALHTGSFCPPQGIVQGGMHAREFITAVLVLEQLKYGLCRGGAWFVPLMNPDGALLSECGISTIHGKYQRQMIENVGGTAGFSAWKANAHCVDLNVNFDACWGKGKQNVRIPAPANYIGTKPFSEPESRALREFTLEVCPNFTLSYHTKGEEIYWKFHQPPFACQRDRDLAELLSQATCYSLCETADSTGGYKDWCICALGIPAFTVEVGKDTAKHPLGREELPAIIERNLTSVRVLTENI